MPAWLISVIGPSQWLLLRMPAIESAWLKSERPLQRFRNQHPHLALPKQRGEQFIGTLQRGASIAG